MSRTDNAKAVLSLLLPDKSPKTYQPTTNPNINQITGNFNFG